MLKMSNWYKNIKTASPFGTEPFGSGELSDKTTCSPFGAAGGDEKTGYFAPSSANSHDPNDYFSEDKKVDLLEKRLRDKKKRKKKMIPKVKKVKAENINVDERINFAKYNKQNIVTGQWGSNGPKMPTWENSDWVTDTYEKIIGKDKKEENQQPPQNQSKNNIQHALNASVTISAVSGKEEEIGSGFFVDSNTILTCAHVVTPAISKGQAKITIKVNNKQYNGKLIAYDQSIDTAVLAIDQEGYQFRDYLKLGDSDKAIPGEDIVIIGTPLGFENIVGKGIVSSTPINYNEGGININYLFVSASVAPGNSGGPVLRAEDNSVIGIAAATITSEDPMDNGLNAAIPINDIKRFLQSKGITIGATKQSETTYDLYKKAFVLNTEQKEYLVNSLDNIISVFKEEEVLGLKKEAIKKEASGSHDPETIEDMKKLLNLFEKYLSFDQNLSYSNVSIFLHPLSSGSKKVSLRPCKIVGLMRKLDQLSRMILREDIDKNMVKKEFFSNLNKIKKRLSPI